MIKLTNEAHLPLAVHCIGDGGLEQMLQGLERLDQINCMNRVIHCQFASMDQYKRIKALGCAIDFQPPFIMDDYPIAETRVGKERVRTSYNVKTMMDMGINVSSGSDSPVDIPSPIEGIHALVNRQDLKYLPRGGFLPDQAITVEQAIDSYTLNGGLEIDGNRYGKIDNGCYANFTVLDRDLLNTNKLDILKTKVLYTIVNGNIVYKN
jgi:predicted amidohydrolase YtcJ